MDIYFVSEKDVIFKIKLSYDTLICFNSSSKTTKLADYL